MSYSPTSSRTRQQVLQFYVGLHGFALYSLGRDVHASEMSKSPT